MSNAARASVDRDQDGGAAVSARVSSFVDGMLSGSIVARGSTWPESLLVIADGRFVGEACIVWDGAMSGEGAWSFDAMDLPPDLLLQDRVRVAIALSEPQTILASGDIDPTRFPPLPDLSRGGRSRLEGFVDGTENGVVRGWLREPTNSARRVKLRLYIDARFCGAYVADRKRADLEAAGLGDGRYGFSIPAQAFFARATSPRPSVRVCAVPDLWEIPPAPHLQPRWRRSGMPRLRDVPGTTRELVALLASTEPFPKKTFVIDRLTRKMPEAFSADYVLLAIDYLRVEMLKAPPPVSATWRERVVAWWRQRLIRGQIRRLSALADAAAASQRLLETARKTPPGASGS